MAGQGSASWGLESLLSRSLYALAPVLAALLLGQIYRRQRKIWLIEQLPGPKGLPLVGNLLHMWVDHEELFRRLCKICDLGNVARFWVGSKPYCIVSSARAVETILSSSKHIDKSWDYTLFRPWLGEGLVTSSGVKWHTHRKMLTPAFHFKILEDFVEVFTAQAETLVEKLKTKADGRPFDIYNDITLCALDIICETAMGRSINAQRNSESDIALRPVRLDPTSTPYRQDGRTLIQFRQFRPWLHSDFAFRLSSYGREQEKCLRRHRTPHARIRYVPGQKPRQAFLDLLLEYSEKDPTTTDEDIRDEVNTFMFAGHDTTSAAMNWFLYAMGSHPDAQERVFEEIEAVLRGSGGAPSASDLREMKYLELCLKETLRLFPPIPVIIRELKEDAVINNYSIPAGTSVVIHVYRLHHDPEQFPDPEAFDPDRFLPQNSTRRHSYAYVPFSAGPRNCIAKPKVLFLLDPKTATSASAFSFPPAGQKFSLLEMKAILCSILRRFRVESVVPRKDLKLLAELILLPKGGNLVRLFPRAGGDGGQRGGGS
ncbi:Cytochrome P450 4C1 [Penaeus vannamei]|uniref:Cytochrome P450 4C1 n=1 Tax=Penaeus vannamei TaxID=6689 RepID=A0A3R7LUU5_PENVA|nr:Cytochrome P450 4C1 [Penaeus vannamei]